MGEISFQLSSTDREALLASAPQYSEIWNALRYALRPTSDSLQDAHYQILCDPAGAEVLLHMAQTHCPGAVKDIELAIETSRAGDR
jgi:hypothetical protein